MEDKTKEIQKVESDFWGMPLKQFTVFMHVAQFATFIIPLAGYVLPFVMWFQYKDQNETIDEHGKNIINWLISSLIYLAIAGILCVILVGFLLLPAVGICMIVFPILGAIKANEDQAWKYPITINFLK